MARPPRIHFPGLIYHILNRGNNQQIVFVADEDYKRYLEVLRKYKEKFKFQIYAYCLMTNHIHLLLKTTEAGNISQIMQSITISHTQHYHYTYQTSGHIWQGRFKSPIVSNDEYLLTAMRYIEQNPVRAGAADDPGEYGWSSYKANGLGKDDGLVDRAKNPVYIGLGNSLEESSRRYRDGMIELLEKEKVEGVRKSLRGGGHYMSESFEKEIEEKLTLRKKKKRRGRPAKDGENNN